jgi:hypothetical protein
MAESIVICKKIRLTWIKWGNETNGLLFFLLAEIIDPDLDIHNLNLPPDVVERPKYSASFVQLEIGKSFHLLSFLLKYQSKRYILTLKSQ